LTPGSDDTRFFERAGMRDTKVEQDQKDDPADVARAGYGALINGEGDVVSDWINKIQASRANVTPAGVLAEQHLRVRTHNQ